MQTYQLVNHICTDNTVMVTIHRHFDHQARTPTGAEMDAVFCCISPRGVGGNELYFAILKAETITYSEAQAYQLWTCTVQAKYEIRHGTQLP
jgi:hypothetical protein